MCSFSFLQMLMIPQKGGQVQQAPDESRATCYSNFRLIKVPATFSPEH